jgi:NadR type nicotinamide-nucleotide adenylyltransferase
MSVAWVLMTALPPTTGHLHLIRFASHVADQTRVLVCTQPVEPYVSERVSALRLAFAGTPRVKIDHLHATMPQEPGDDPRFWDIWLRALTDRGMASGGDFIVASESYGETIATLSGNVFVPYDLDRVIHPARASLVRSSPRSHFDDVLPEFQPVLRKRITILGAESTGKTTLSRDLAAAANGHWLPEWARPYLEQTDSPLVDQAKMETIWRGQRALQLHGLELRDKPFIIQDTDLFATVGYWRHWQPDGLPARLPRDALDDASDLYLLTSSTIPFEPDPLRYGGDRRETTDEYWIDLADEFGLNYAVIDSLDRDDRIAEASLLVTDFFDRTSGLDYHRSGKH